MHNSPPNKPTTAPTTVGDWLANVQPAPPALLATQLKELLSHAIHRPASEVTDVCLETAESLLKDLMQSGSTDRATALTLLSVDALVTYAFEAASIDSSRFETRAANAMKRIAALAEASD